MTTRFLEAAAMLSLGIASVQAQDLVLADEMNHITLRGGVGILAIESREYVFQSPGSSDYMSLLIWQSAAPLLTTSLDVQLPANWTFGIAANAAVSGDSYMEDYDWLVPQPGSPDMSNWSDRSRHSNTNLDWYFNGSMQLGYNVHQEAGTTVNLHAGVEYTDVQWTAYDGTYIYSNGGFRNDRGSFSGRGITYRQKLPNFFAGLNGTIERDQWTFHLGAKAGVTFAAKAIDHHWMTDTRYDEDVYAAPVLGLSAAADYQLNDRFNLFVGGELDRVFLGRSDAALSQISTGASGPTVPNASGADLLSGMLKVGFKGSF